MFFFFSFLHSSVGALDVVTCISIDLYGSETLVTGSKDTTVVVRSALSSVRRGEVVITSRYGTLTIG